MGGLPLLVTATETRRAKKCRIGGRNVSYRGPKSVVQGQKLSYECYNLKISQLVLKEMLPRQPNIPSLKFNEDI